MQLSGALAAAANTLHGVVLKYSEPPEARRPKRHWRLFPFKGREQLESISLAGQSAFLLGRERRVADIPLDHPSCSGQHAAIQFRQVPDTTGDGRSVRRIRPYIIDLESANGTFLNGARIEPRRYYELCVKDVLRFAYSTREYVVLSDDAVDAAPSSSPAPA